jgi:hypothetical protein
MVDQRHLWPCFTEINFLEVAVYMITFRHCTARSATLIADLACVRDKALPETAPKLYRAITHNSANYQIVMTLQLQCFRVRCHSFSCDKKNNYMHNNDWTFHGTHFQMTSILDRR